MRRYRIGIFGRGTAPTDGGADTLLRTLQARFATLGFGIATDTVIVPWSAWSHRRRPVRYLWSRFVRAFGGEIPLVDLRPLCRRLKLDLAYFAAPAFVHIDIPFVFTVWDLGHRTIPEFPEMRSGRDPWTHREALYRRMLAQASCVIVGNETGAREIRDAYGIAPERIATIAFPNPDFSSVKETRPTWLPASPFFFYPAQLWPHKNHVTLIRALAELRMSRSLLPHLVLTGSDKGNREYLRMLATREGVAAQVTFSGFVTLGELKALYHNATALAFPSLLGPNNLPPQEAAMLGCPAVLSDLPGHREQMGDGALYAPPFDAPAWAECMTQLVTNLTLRDALTKRAAVMVQGCTIDAYADHVGQILHELLSRRRLWA